MKNHKTTSDRSEQPSAPNGVVSSDLLDPISIISLGAGVQSSTMALMAARGEIAPMPKYAIFSDVGAEPKNVYDYLDYLEKLLPFPVLRVMHKDGLTKAIEKSLKSGSISGSPPWFSAGKDGKAVLLSRACTHDFKIHPIQQAIRRLTGAKRGSKKTHAVLWIGISTDEAQRIKDSRYPHYIHRHPLIEKGMSRNNCLAWMERNGYQQPPKSSCVYCPFHSNPHWRQIKDTDPAGWAEAVRVDNLIRDGVRRNGKPPMYAHRSLKPLNEIDLTTDLDRGQELLWGNECEGMCGV